MGPTILLVLGGACGKTDYGSGCEKATELGAPWTGMSLPLDDKKTRVCESSAEELKLRSYAWTSKEEAGPALEQALVAAGWTKDRCTEQACYYDKEGYEVSVQPMDFEVKKKKLVTIALRHKEDARQKNKVAKADAGKGKAAAADEAEAAPSGGTLGVAACDEYVAQVEACATFDKNAKPYTTMLDKWKQAIAEGKGDQVATACSKAASIFKCQ